MDRDKLEFVTYCIGAVANSLGMPRNDVYGRLKCSGILDDYVIGCYDVAHTLDRGSIVYDITDFMKKKGVLTK